MNRTGGCLCGAVKFTAVGEPKMTSVCHCSMCLRWAGGPMISVNFDAVDFEASNALKTVQSSKWAERGFCGDCGSALFYRITAEGKYHGVIAVALGSLDDRDGLTMTKEWFVDKKPSCYTFAGELEGVTEAEFNAAMSQM